MLIEGAPPALTAHNLAGFAYLGLVNTGIAYALWFRGVERLRATQVTFLALLSPVVAVAAGFLVKGQALTIAQLIGVLVVLGSIVAAQRVGAPAVAGPEDTSRFSRAAGRPERF